ncbi:hypothetical protein GCM10007939_21810 [Amylibacter marinus]|uniref:Lipoprotein n=1 Tax=Amylibacter marinus TaxID=1475483 RepID=A0ABQ5VXG8_9RHOB|nr:hypothetical protein [Amylibacter marinus]GLQ35897.1 hypothetical protein GCM10007939_21810 [Amylibacter marinus]
MGYLRAVAALAALVVLSACAKDVGDSDRAIQEVSYSHSSPPSLTLLTMVHNTTGAGGHSSLLINGSERVMYDPAGRFKTRAVREQGDILYGVTPAVMKRYQSFHARDTHHVVIQEIPVSAKVAEIALREAIKQGPSHDAMCAANTSAMLKRIPGFEDVGSTFSPKGLSRRFGKLEGVVETKYYENDIGQN